MVNDEYENGYSVGNLRRHDPSYDVRWDMADAAKRGGFAEFKRGLEDGFDGKPKNP
jgi:hypothetical protein